MNIELEPKSLRICNLRLGGTGRPTAGDKGLGQPLAARGPEGARGLGAPGLGPGARARGFMPNTPGAQARRPRPFDNQRISVALSMALPPDVYGTFYGFFSKRRCSTRANDARSAPPQRGGPPTAVAPPQPRGACDRCGPSQPRGHSFNSSPGPRSVTPCSPWPWPWPSLSSAATKTPPAKLLAYPSRASDTPFAHAQAGARNPA